MRGAQARTGEGLRVRGLRKSYRNRPVIRDVAQSLRLSPKRFLMPLSHVTVMGGLLSQQGLELALPTLIS